MALRSLCVLVGEDRDAQAVCHDNPDQTVWVDENGVAYTVALDALSDLEELLAEGPLP